MLFTSRNISPSSSLARNSSDTSVGWRISSSPCPCSKSRGDPRPCPGSKIRPPPALPACLISISVIDASISEQLPELRASVRLRSTAERSTAAAGDGDVDCAGRCLVFSSDILFIEFIVGDLLRTGVSITPIHGN